MGNQSLRTSEVAFGRWGWSSKWYYCDPPYKNNVLIFDYLIIIVKENGASKVTWKKF